MVREKQEKMDKEQKKQLAEGLVAAFDNIPAKCPECGGQTNDEWCTLVRRREYPDPEGYDVMFRCETCGESFDELR
jgi:DNA-directed RNA polymerase subunit M/transcription elongation factor TFIIS